MAYRLAMSFALAAAIAAPVGAQSLAELARQEEARRKAIKVPAKVYTNEDVRGGTPAPGPVSAPASPVSPASPTPSAAPARTEPAPDERTADTATGAEPAQGEQYWRKRIQGARDALARAEIFAEALQSRINALTTDFVNRDDPAQRAVIAADREKALAELERVKREIAQFTKDIAAIQDEARRAGVPPGWLR